MSKAVKKKKPETSESKLMTLLRQNTATDLLEQKVGIVKLLVNEISSGLTIQKAIESPKIFQVKKNIGMENLIKLLCVIIKSFCDSIKAKNSMDAGDIFECAELLAETYTHDSVKDIVMALKQAKKKGHIFYNSTISIPIVFEIVSEYMNHKTAWIEKTVEDKKSFYDGSVRTESNTIAVIHERRNQEKEKTMAEKTLQEIKSEKKEIQKIEQFITKNVDRLKE